MRKLLILLFLTLFSLGAQAGIEKNDKTVSIFGAYTSSDDSDTLILQAAAGYFVTDTLELQAVILQVASEDNVGNTTAVGGYGVNANLYIPGKSPDLIPYVGAGGTLILTDFNGMTDTTLGLNAQAGLKQFLKENIAVNYQAQLVSSDTYDATILSVGFTIFLE
jgi:membrane-associated protease RseP (regulator of RpoE activity)